jgi:hypothetical protein
MVISRYVGDSLLLDSQVRSKGYAFNNEKERGETCQLSDDSDRIVLFTRADFIPLCKTLSSSGYPPRGKISWEV